MKSLAILGICIAALSLGVLGLGYSSCGEPPTSRSESRMTAPLDKSDCALPSGVFKAGLWELWIFVHPHDNEGRSYDHLTEQ